MTDAIVAEGLVKSFGDATALDGVDLTCRRAPCSGLLGPNGAGKTTVVRILTTLLRADAGRAEVAGLDVVRDADEVRASIGLSGQYAAVDEYLTGFENLEMVGRLYHLAASARPVAGATSCWSGSTSPTPRDRPAKTYSGGMRRRLDLAAALVARPPVLFLDEPTTGLDPRSRLGMWEVIADLVARRAPRCCSPPSTWRRPTGSPTRSWSSTTAGSSPAAPPTSSRPRSAASGSRSPSADAGRRRRGRRAAARRWRSARRSPTSRRRRLTLPVRGGTDGARRGAAPARRQRHRGARRRAAPARPWTTCSSRLTGHAAEDAERRAPTDRPPARTPADDRREQPDDARWPMAVVRRPRSSPSAT